MSVVITGLGVVSCVGNDVETLWENVVNGVSGFSPVPDKKYKVAKTKKTGSIQDFSLSKTFDPRWRSKTDRHIQLALNATEQAVLQSGLDFNKLDPSRVHTILGTCAGGYDSIAKVACDLEIGLPARPNFIPGTISNMISAYINMHYGIHGSGLCLAGACAAGNQAAAVAAMMIETGQADVVITGGSDSWLSEVSISGLESLRALSFSDILPRPFDKNRDGFAISEGAGIMIFESQEHATKRDANILARLSGYGIGSDAYHPTSPSPEGEVVISMVKNALKRANLNESDIDYINTHATGTVIGDKVECQTMYKIFNDSPYISGTKSMTGHSIGSSSAIEAIISIQSLITGLIPGTINLTELDPECPGKHVFKTMEYPVKNVLSNSFGFGGTNGVLIFSKK